MPVSRSFSLASARSEVLGLLPPDVHRGDHAKKTSQSRSRQALHYVIELNAYLIDLILT